MGLTALLAEANTVLGVATAGSRTGLYATFDAADYDQVEVSTGLTQTQDALNKYELYMKKVLKEASYDIACWKSTPASTDSWVANTDQWLGAGTDNTK